MRKTRKLQRGASYHVVARANRQEFILASDTVKQLFLKTLLGAKERHRFEVITLCLMNNHVHLMLRPGGGGAEHVTAERDRSESPRTCN